MKQKKIVVVDIDGTIAKVGDRLKYLEQVPKDWDAFYAACDEDKPILPIMVLVNILAKTYDIVFCTGRRESEREKTRAWIVDNMGFNTDINYHTVPIVMRQDGDFRHDIDVKPEEMMRSGFPIETIAYVLEDRNSMVAMWRQLGLTCLQVADGDF